jgi:hypothetical protein
MNPYEQKVAEPKETVKTIDVESLTPEELYRKLSRSFVFIRIKH